ncbi:hypothetical protein [Nostoc sp.]|uniref:hypothetical protein n=1 Tax=Nostoc sp. TaxID=1180 RepID=UPI002FF5928F
MSTMVTELCRSAGYANAPFNNLRAVFAIFCMAPSFGFGSGAMSTTGYAYASDNKSRLYLIL